MYLNMVFVCRDVQSRKLVQPPFGFPRVEPFGIGALSFELRHLSHIAGLSCLPQRLGGMTWCGVAWNGVAWCGVAWRGVV